MRKNKWWHPDASFFGNFYVTGDNSTSGYLIENDQTLTERTMTEVDGIVKLLSLHSEDKILDCPCGYGRHSIELAKRGYIVTASDINSTHLNIMSTKMADHFNTLDDLLTPDISDMRYLQFNSNFNIIINMFYSFGFFETDAENELVLYNFYQALKPGGKFLMHTDVNLPRVLSGDYRFSENRDLHSGQALRIIESYNPKTKRIDGTWIIDGVSKKYSVRVYSKSEFVQMCFDVGLTSSVAYSSWRGDPYTKTSEDMMIVAIK